ncbi:MAG: PepSY domain-containing protein [Boseongicola sp.]|nr:MAG: PepSY domain-containing protein [Boseongicola sp.]
MTRNPFPMISAAALTVLIPAAAFANFSVGDTLGTDLEEIRAKFEAQGYTVTEIEAEDGEIEVEYLMDGQEYEVTIASDTGTVVEIEAEDGDDDDDGEDDDE